MIPGRVAWCAVLGIRVLCDPTGSTTTERGNTMSLDILGAQDEIRDKWYTRTSDGTLVEKPGLQIVVMMTMLTGVPEINERTAPLFWDRIYLYQKAIGAIGRKTVDGITSDWFMTPATVREFIGLRTNVTRKTDAQFWKLIGQVARDDSARAWDQ